MAFGIDDALGGIAGALGGILGGIFGSGDQQKANDLLKQAFDEINSVGAPPDIAKQIIYDKFSQAGMYTPALQNVIDQNYSAMATLQDSSQGRDAQLQALQQLQQRGQVGVTAEERAALNPIRQAAQRDAAARDASVLQSLQARGQAGSGAELAAMLGHSQNAAQTEANQSDQIMADANRRALQSIQAAGQAGSQLRSQDVNINSQRAQAQDEMNRFNIQNQRAVQAANINAQNQAQQANLAEKQKIQDTNTALANQELSAQRQRQMQEYQATLAYAKDKAAAAQKQAENYAGQAANTRGTVGGIAQGIGQGASSIVAANNNQLPAPDNSLATEEAKTKKKHVNDLGIADDGADFESLPASYSPYSQA